MINGTTESADRAQTPNNRNENETPTPNTSTSHQIVEQEDAVAERRKIVQLYLEGREKALKRKAIFEEEEPIFQFLDRVDRYGFIHDTPLPSRFTDHETKTREKEISRSDKWAKMNQQWDDYAKKHTEKIRSRVYKGIPDNWRGEIWKKLLDIPEVQKAQEGKYQEMLQWGLQHSKDVRQIDLDVNRTFRNHESFKDRYSIKQQELFKVLVAYSVYNSEIGYCQGMSQIAALLLMYMTEEDAFWSLSQLMTDGRHAMHGFFISGFPKLIRFSRHHDQIIKKFLPKVFKHLKKYDIDSTLYTLKWFFQCFLDRVPFSLTLRLWDCFMYDGEKILTGMSYTLLKLHKKSILKKRMEELIEFLQVDLEKDFGFHDDEAIKALSQSLEELKRYNMEVPKEPAPDIEKPQKPFGFLVQMDALDATSSIMSTDDRSVVGSIVIPTADSISLAQTSRTSMGTDINERNEIDDIEDIDAFDENCIGDRLSLYDNVDIKESLEAAQRAVECRSPSRSAGSASVTVSRSPSRSPLPTRRSKSPSNRFVIRLDSVKIQN